MLVARRRPGLPPPLLSSPAQDFTAPTANAEPPFRWRTVRPPSAIPTASTGAAQSTDSAEAPR